MCYYHDPHSSYNSNFPEEDWIEYQRNSRTLAVCDSVSSVLASGLVAVIRVETLCELNFDVKSRVDYPAPLLQMTWYPHWAAWAIAAMTHSCFTLEKGDDRVRFYKSPYDNEPYVPGNVDFLEPELGRAFGEAILKSKKKQMEKEQLDMFEF